jgi:hypothetical protein
MSMVILTALPMILFFAGWTIDYTKNAAVRSDLNDIAQESVQSAVREQNSSGALQCGQDSTYEMTHDSTPQLVVRGLSKIQRLAQGDYTAINGVSGTGNSMTYSGGGKFNKNSAASLSQLAAAYLQKTGRDSGTTSVYGSNDKYSAANDARFVSSMRSFVDKGVHDSAEQSTLEKNYGYSGAYDAAAGTRPGNNSSQNKTHTFYNGTSFDGTGSDLGVNNSLNSGSPANSFTVNNDDTLVMIITCSKGLKNAGSYNEDTVGSSNTFTTIDVDIRDWTSNFVMGMFNSEWDVQRFRINPRATTSWSTSVVGYPNVT